MTDNVWNDPDAPKDGYDLQRQLRAVFALFDEYLGRSDVFAAAQAIDDRVCAMQRRGELCAMVADAACQRLEMWKRAATGRGAADGQLEVRLGTCPDTLGCPVCLAMVESKPITEWVRCEECSTTLRMRGSAALELEP